MKEEGNSLKMLRTAKIWTTDGKRSGKRGTR